MEREERKEGDKLPLSFFQREDVVGIARELCGKVLCTHIDGKLTKGLIIETESYRGPEDRASHAWNNRRTKRTEVMFHHGGLCYVYLCYGIHHLLNVVTHREGVPHAILIRALKPLSGLEIMEKRRKGRLPLTEGPGSVAQAMGITLSHNGTSLSGDLIWIEEGNHNRHTIEISPRIGVEYAGADAALPWRNRIV